MKSIILLPHPAIRFLEDRLGIYVNSSGAEICLREDMSLSVSCRYPGHQSKNTRIFHDYSTAWAFLKCFEIGSSTKLDSITPTKCLRLFNKGKMQLYCVTHQRLEQAMLFRKKGSGIYAIDEEEREHKLACTITSVTDFENYANQYYTLANATPLFGTVRRVIPGIVT